MEHLWSPWRSQYISSFSKKPESESCVLCDAVAATPDHDEGNLVVHRSASCIVIMNRYPYNAGHLMVVPNVHCGAFGLLPAGVAMFPLEPRVDRLLKQWRLVLPDHIVRNRA
ncbi:MAG: hypothetical protein ACKOB6_03880, partial [Candidatus Kapaibacterium sp.]